MVKGFNIGLAMFSFIAILAILFAGLDDSTGFILVLLNSIFMILNFWLAFKEE